MLIFMIASLCRFLLVTYSVMRPFDLRKLMLHYRKHIWRKILFQHPLIILHSSVFAPLAFRDNRITVSACYDRFDVDPPAIECARHAPLRVGIATQPSDFSLEFRGELGSLDRGFSEEFLQV